MRRVRRYVSRAVYVREGKILLAKSDGKSNFFLPGGEINTYESAAAALLREVKEEMNRNAEIVDFIGAVENNWGEGGIAFYETNFLFSINISGSGFEDRFEVEDGLSFEWVPLNDMDNVDIRPGCIKRYVKDISHSRFKTLWFSNFR